MSDTTSFKERLSSPLTYYYAGIAVLLVLAIGLAVRLALDWAAVDQRAEQVLASKQLELHATELQTAPLRGLDKKVDLTRGQMRSFYDKRIPPNYSSIASRIDELAVKSGVHLSLVQYTQGNPGVYLTEISMDAGISGQYPQIMQFINSLERDQTFFVIRAMTLTGQNGGLVNLRLRVSTWLRPADAAASGLPSTEAAGGGSAETDTAAPDTARPGSATPREVE